MLDKALGIMVKYRRTETCDERKEYSDSIPQRARAVGWEPGRIIGGGRCVREWEKVNKSEK